MTSYILRDFAMNRLGWVASACSPVLLTAAAPVHAGPDTARAAVVFDVKRGGAFAADGRYEGGRFVSVRRAAMPAPNRQGSGWVRYEGPALESAKVGFRLYLDARNKLDAFGKRTLAPALAGAGDDYHRIAPWGADVLKVGESLGIGSIAALTDAGPEPVANVRRRSVKVLATGGARAAVRIDYAGWRVAGRRHDAHAQLSIEANSRCVRHDFAVGGESPSIITGLVRHVGAPQLVMRDEAGMRFWYTWGPQSEHGDHLGLAIIAVKNEARAGPLDRHSHLVALDRTRGRTRHWACAMWGLEPGEPSTARAFEAALRAEARAIATDLAKTA